MSEPSPPEKKTARKRAPAESAEDLINSPTAKRTSKATSSAKKAAKLVETESNEPHQLSEVAKPSASVVEETKDKTTTTAPTSSTTTSNAAEIPKPAPKNAVATPVKATGKSTSAVSAKLSAARPAASPSKSTSSSSSASRASYDFTSNFEKVLQTAAKKNFLPHRTKKQFSSGSGSNIPPNDLDISDTIRDTVEIVREHAMGEVLEVSFPAYANIATSRPSMIHEMYTALSI